MRKKLVPDPLRSGFYLTFHAFRRLIVATFDRRREWNIFVKSHRPNCPNGGGSVFLLVQLRFNGKKKGKRAGK